MTFKYLPAKTHVTSLFGIRIHPLTKVRKMHQGVDFSAHGDRNIYAVGNGTVRLATHQSGYGNLILISHEAQGVKYESLYAHLSQINVKVGQKVNGNDVVGIMGQSGISAGIHLHFELFSPKFSSNYSTALDPLLYIKGDEFTNIQVKLKRAGYDVEVDGFMGKNTIEAIKKFQKDSKILSDGFAGLSTMRLLDIASTAIIPPVPNPTPTPQPDQVASTHSVPKPTSDELTLSSPSLKAEVDNILASKANITKIIETAIQGGANEKVWMDKLENREYTNGDILGLATKFIIDLS